VKVIVPALFKPLSNGTAIVADSCHSALIEVARHVQNRRTITTFLGFAVSKSREHRLVVAEALAIWIATWPDSATGPVKPDITRTLKALVDDASAEVRKAAREVRDPTPTPPRPKESARRPKSAIRSRSPAPKSPNKVRFVDFVEMPDVGDFEQPKSIMKRPRPPKPIEKPKSMADAESFLQVLTDLVATDGYVQKLNAKREVLPEAVVAGVQFIPEFEDWRAVLAPFFETFTDEFFDMVPDLFAMFRFDPGFFDMICNAFPIDSLTEKFRTLRNSQQAVSIRFFSMLQERSDTLVLNPELRKYLNRLVQNSANRRDAESIRSYLAKSSNPRRPLTDFLEKFSSKCNFKAELIKLRQDPNLLGYEPDLSGMVLRVLTKGSDFERANIIAVVSALSALHFAQLRESLTNQLLCDEFPHREVAIGCFAALLDNNQILRETLDSLSEADGCDDFKAQTVLAVIHRFVSDADHAKLAEVLPVMFGHVAALLEVEIIPLRRLAVFILVEFNVKIAQDFAKFLRKISTPHQKLIELYTAKRRK
jgi:hypothetical protein